MTPLMRPHPHSHPTPPFATTCSRSDAGKVYLVGGKGDTWRNGKPVREGTEVALDIYDRVGMGDQLMVRLGPIYQGP